MMSDPIAQDQTQQHETPSRREILVVCRLRKAPGVMRIMIYAPENLCEGDHLIIEGDGKRLESQVLRIIARGPGALAYFNISAESKDDIKEGMFVTVIPQDMR